MTRLEELAIKHAELSERIKVNLERASLELSYCKGGNFEVEDITPCAPCTVNAYNMTERLNSQLEDDEGPEVYDYILVGHGCRHCIQARTLKRYASSLRVERGRVRASITKIGKRLSEEYL